MLTERGNRFGFTELVLDFRNIPIMQSNNCPVIMDCTHALQQPNQATSIKGGTPQHIETIAKCAIAPGANGLYIATHPDPKNAKSDGANMLPLNEFEVLMQKLVRLKMAL
jgi:2-dehydro-3-deoxyphosphooctonate aldolase (KDO 8-P synthase)